MTVGKTPAAIVSYGHADPGWTPEQVAARSEQVTALVAGLRRNGIDVTADVFHDNEDWTRWGPRMIEERDYVLIVASRAWRDAWMGSGDELANRGLRSEADIVRSIQNQGQGELQQRCRVVLLPGSSEQDIPAGLEGLARSSLEDFRDSSLEPLVRSLTGQPVRVLPPLGLVPDLPPIEDADGDRTSVGLSSAETTASTPQASGLWHPAVPVDLDWSESWGQLQSYSLPTIGIVHLVPVPQTALSQRRMSGIAEVAALALREHVTPYAEILPTTTAETVNVTAAEERLSYDQPRPSQLLGVRVARKGQVSVWFSLPRDRMGAVLDRQDLAAIVVSASKVASTVLAALGIKQEQQVVLGAEVANTMLLTDGKISDLGRRSSASMRGAMSRPLRVSPDESVSAEALCSEEVREVANTMAQVVYDEWTR